MRKYDLHTHSIYSDGLMGAAELIEKITKAGLSGFSLTDHDTFSGIPHFIKALEENGSPLDFIPGIEFSSTYEYMQELHILAYFPKGNYEKFKPLLRKLQERRRERAEKIISCLNKEGMNINMSDVLNEIENKGQDVFPVGRMHIARALINKGFFQYPQQVFNAYLKVGRPCYLPKEKINAPDLIRTIIENGGFPAVAHPTFLSDKRKFDIINSFIEIGLKGIEAYHPKITSSLAGKIQKKFSDSLILLGGSDYHGDVNQNELGNYSTDYNNVILLKNSC